MVRSKRGLLHDQYSFSNATDIDKSEILKDILAFANAFRREGAFILIGVEDIRGGRANVVGTPEHIDDAQRALRSSGSQYVAPGRVHSGKPVIESGGGQARCPGIATRVRER